MALDPNIAMGYRGIEIANPLAQYGQLAQIQNYQNQNIAAQNQNALAQYQLGAAQRADVAAEGLNKLYAKHYDPVKGTVNQNALMAEAASTPGLASQIPKLQEAATKREQEAATLTETKSKTEERQFKLTNDKLKHGLESLTSAPTPQDAIQKLNDGISKGFFDMKTALAEAQKLQNMPLEDYQKYRIEKILGLVDAKDKLGYMLPKTTRQDIGGSIVNIQDNPMLPGYGLPVQGMAPLAKTMTFADRTAQQNANLAREKFTFEKANPGFELKENENGEFFGVNKRTLQAFPVTIGGGAASAVAPMVQGAGGMPGPRMAQPGAVVPAIPGMTSVLDQTAPAVAPAAGGPRQLVGKGTALTESQGNATAFGMRMKEANSILTSLEKSGFKNTGLISNAVGSTVGIVPLLGDKLEGMTGSVFNVLPQIMGGLSPEQQQVAQARVNFITAVLRKESGASIQPSEFSMEEKKYFPKPGDDKTVVAQKQKARDLAIKAMGIQAGPGAKNIEQYAPTSGSVAPTVSNW